MSASPHNVFVYGSLLADDVVSALLNRVPPTSSATLNGYHRFSIKGRVYPAILPVEGKQVDGRVLMGVTTHELNILDVFEDVEYVRDCVEVSLVINYRTISRISSHPHAYNSYELPVAFLKKGGFSRSHFLNENVRVRKANQDVENSEKLGVFTYVWVDKDDPNLYGDWKFEEWKKVHMDGFLRMTKEFAEEYDQPRAKTRVETYESCYNQVADKKAST